MTTEEIYLIKPGKDGWRVLPNGNKVSAKPYLVYPYSLTQVGVGCVIHDIEYWMRPEDPAELADHPECQPWSQYRAAVALVVAWIKEHPLFLLEARH